MNSPIEWVARQAGIGDCICGRRIWNPLVSVWYLGSHYHLRCSGGFLRVKRFWRATEQQQ